MLWSWQLGAPRSCGWSGQLNTPKGSSGEPVWSIPERGLAGSSRASPRTCPSMRCRAGTGACPVLFPRVHRLRAGSRLWRVRAGALQGSYPHLSGLPSPVMRLTSRSPCSRAACRRASTGDCCEHDRGTRGVCYARLHAERDGNLSVACAGTPPGADLGDAFVPEWQGRVPASG